jgi:hypothetical protein
MAQTAITPQVHKSLNIHRDFATKVTFDHVILVNRLANVYDFLFRQVINAAMGFDLDLLANFTSFIRAYPMNIRKRDMNALISWDIDASNSRHFTVLLMPLSREPNLLLGPFRKRGIIGLRPVPSIHSTNLNDAFMPHLRWKQ